MGGGSRNWTLKSPESLHFDYKVKPKLQEYRRSELRPLLIDSGLGKTNIVDALCDMAASIGIFAGMIREGHDSTHLQNYYRTLDSVGAFLKKREVRSYLEEQLALSNLIRGREAKNVEQQPGKPMSLEAFLFGLEQFSNKAKNWLFERIFILKEDELQKEIDSLTDKKQEVIWLKQHIDKFTKDNGLVIAYLPLAFNTQEKELDTGEKITIPTGIKPGMGAYAKLLLFFLDDIEAYLNKFTEEKAFNLFVNGLSATETIGFQAMMKDIKNEKLHADIVKCNNAIRIVNLLYKEDKYIKLIPELSEIPDPIAEEEGENAKEIEEARKKQVLLYLKILIKGFKSIGVAVLEGLIEKYERGIYNTDEEVDTNEDSESLASLANSGLREMAQLIVSLDPEQENLVDAANEYLNGEMEAVIFERFINKQVVAKKLIEAHHKHLAENLKQIIIALQKSVEEPAWYEKMLPGVSFGGNLSVRERETLSLLAGVAESYGTENGLTQMRFLLQVCSCLQLHKPVENSLLSRRIIKHLPTTNYEILSQYYAALPAFSQACLHEHDIFSDSFIEKAATKQQEDDDFDECATNFEEEYDEYLVLSKLIMHRHEDATLQIDGHDVNIKEAAQGLMDNVLPVSYFRKVVVALNATEDLKVHQLKEDFVGQRAGFVARDIANAVLTAFKQYSERMQQGTWGLFFSKFEWHGQAGMLRAKKLYNIAYNYQNAGMTTDKFIEAVYEHLIGKNYTSRIRQARLNENSFDTYLLKALFDENQKSKDIYETVDKVSQGRHKISLGKNATGCYLGEPPMKWYKQDVLSLLEGLAPPTSVQKNSSNR